MAHLSTAWPALVLAAGCIYDSSDRCGPFERVSSAGVCECEDNHVPKPRDIDVFVDEPGGDIGRDGCVPCGKDEVANAGVCDCRKGLVRDEKNTCIKPNVPSIPFGNACSGDADCGDEVGKKCVKDDELADTLRAPYCSFSGCVSNAECPVDAGYACFGQGDSAFCRRPPTGEDDVCDAQGANEMPGTNPACQKEANVCFRDKCRTFDCRTDEECSAGHVCCDLTKLAGRDDAYLCTSLKECFSR